MNKAQQVRFNSLYEQHVNALHRQGKAERTIDSYARAIRRITEFFDQCPDRLSEDQLKTYFTALVKSHSWSTVKIDRNGLQFFYQQVLALLHAIGVRRLCFDSGPRPYKPALREVMANAHLTLSSYIVPTVQMIEH
jgi:hypothetical protein